MGFDFILYCVTMNTIYSDIFHMLTSKCIETKIRESVNWLCIKQLIFILSVGYHSVMMHAQGLESAQKGCKSDL